MRFAIGTMRRYGSTVAGATARPIHRNGYFAGVAAISASTSSAIGAISITVAPDEQREVFEVAVAERASLGLGIGHRAVEVEDQHY